MASFADAARSGNAGGNDSTDLADAHRHGGDLDRRHGRAGLSRFPPVGHLAHFADLRHAPTTRVMPGPIGQWMAGAIPHSQLVELKAAGHSPFWDDPEGFAGAIDELCHGAQAMTAGFAACVPDHQANTGGCNVA